MATITLAATITPEEEEELIVDAQYGDHAAANRLLDSQRPIVAEFVRNQIANRADADDLTQEILCKVWTSLPKFAGKQKFSVWVFQIARKRIEQWKDTHNG